MSDLIGQQWGNYRLVRLLGKGGFAEVYLGEHIRLNMLVAIKILHTHLSEEGTEAFQREAQTIAGLSHPHIVRVLDFDLKEGRPFLIIDYAPNGSLRRLYPKGTSVPLSQIITYVKQVSSALQYAHDLKLIHRDVKPENMLLGQRNEILLSDFGIVTMAHSTSSMSAQPSVGTIPYMAPEQIQSYPRPASDQYALGIVVYQWLCGELPFQGSMTEIIAKHVSVPPPPLRAAVPDLPLEVEQVVMMSLRKDPKERFGNVQAFANALEQASLSKYFSSFSSPSSPSLPLPDLPLAPAYPEIVPTALAAPEQRVTPAGITAPAQNALPTDPPIYPFPQPGRPEKGSVRKIVFKQGLIFGGILIVAGYLLGWLISLVLRPLVITVTQYSVLASGLSLVLAAIVFFFAGMRTASLTGKVSMGIVACLWTALWQLLAFPILFLIGILTASPLFKSNPAFMQIEMNIFLYDLVAILISSLILGVGLGALGALLGRSISKQSRHIPSSYS
jgi:serine/threonine protein kinase